jgi:hypothetical protein
MAPMEEILYNFISDAYAGPRGACTDIIARLAAQCDRTRMPAGQPQLNLSSGGHMYNVTNTFPDYLNK